MREIRVCEMKGMESEIKGENDEGKGNSEMRENKN